MEHILSLSAIRERMDALKRTIAESQSQLVDLEVAERIVRRFGQATQSDRPGSADMDDLLAGADAYKQDAKRKVIDVLVERALTNRALFKSVLRQSVNPWLTANEIQVSASSIKGQEVPMATVSPTLSNMKNAGEIVRDGLKVALADRINENGLQDGLPPQSPETALDAQ